MKLTKEQKAKLVERLGHPWGSVSLVCDGDKVTLTVLPAKGLKFHIATYVNGWFRGEWMRSDSEAREQRYLRKVTRPLVSPAKRQKAEKEYGKRLVKSMALFSGTYTIYEPTWPNGSAAIAHLCKICDSISIEDDFGVAVPDAIGQE